MATHFLARPVGDQNYPTPVEEFTTSGSKEVLVNPRTTNVTDKDIEGVALLNIAGRQHTIALTHLHEEVGPENPNMITYSYFLSTPESGYNRDVRNIYKYINNTSRKESTYIYYDMDEMLEDVNFEVLGNWDWIYNDPSFGRCIVIDFKTYILYINEDGTIPSDDFKNQVPYEIDNILRPNFVNSLYLRYLIEWSTSNDSGVESFENFDDFVLAKQRYVNNYDNYTSLSWRIRLYISSNINDSLFQRGDTITLDPVNVPTNIPIDPTYGVKKPKPLYLNLVQQAGYNTLRLIYQKALKTEDMSEILLDSNFGYWSVNENYHDLLSNGDLIYIRYLYNDHIVFGDFQLNPGESLGYITLEFSNGSNYANEGHLSFQSGSEWMYVGKPFFLGMRKDTPSESKLVWGIDCGNQDEIQNFFCRPHFSHMGLKSTHWNVYGNGGNSNAWLWQGSENIESNWCQVLMFPIWGRYNGNQIYNPSETPSGPHGTLQRFLINWLDKSYDRAKVPNGDGGTDPRFAGGLSARGNVAPNTLAFRVSGMNDEPTGTAESFAQTWEESVRGNYHFSEVLMVPILVTPRKLLTSDRVNTDGNGMCIGKINCLSTFKEGLSNNYVPDYLGVKIEIDYKDS